MAVAAPYNQLLVRSGSRETRIHAYAGEGISLTFNPVELASEWGASGLPGWIQYSDSTLRWVFSQEDGSVLYASYIGGEPRHVIVFGIENMEGYGTSFIALLYDSRYRLVGVYVVNQLEEFYKEHLASDAERDVYDALSAMLEEVFTMPSERALEEAVRKALERLGRYKVMVYAGMGSNGRGVLFIGREGRVEKYEAANVDALDVETYLERRSGRVVISILRLLRYARR